MPKIAAVAVAVPPHRITQPEAAAFAAAHFRTHREEIDRMLPVFDHAGIRSRYFCVPPEWHTEPHSFREANELYIEWSTKLGAQVIDNCLRQVGRLPGEIDHLLFVSTTGLATPSIDARLVNVLGLNPHIRRTPIWGLGCAGGAAGLSHAYQLALADPTACVMLVAVELCGLTFQSDDYSTANMVACALFADGAAGVLVTGDEVDADGPSIVGTQSTIWPDSLGVMGWNFTAHGMQVVFSRAIPAIVREKARRNLDEFLAGHGLSCAEVRHWILHPGGQKVLEAYAQALDLAPDDLAVAREVLCDYGNMSSPTVLFVLEKVLSAGRIKPGETALLTALGPGFSAENVLLAGQ